MFMGLRPIPCLRNFFVKKFLKNLQKTFMLLNLKAVLTKCQHESFWGILKGEFLQKFPLKRE